MPSVFDEIVGSIPDKESAPTNSVFDSIVPKKKSSQDAASGKQKSIFDEALPPEGDLTPSGKSAFNPDGTLSQSYFEEVVKKQPVLDALYSGIGQTAENITNLISNLREGRESGVKGAIKGALVNFPEAALAGAEDYVALAGAAKDQIVDKFGRVIGKGPEWERHREYERWLERQAEGQRREDGKSRLGDVFRTIGDVREAEAIDKSINQKASETMSLVTDPSFLLSGGASGSLRAIGKAAFVKGVQGTIGAERAAKVARLAESALEIPIVKQGREAISKVSEAIDSPSALALEGAAKTTGLTRKALENVAAPVLGYVEKRPLLSMVATGVGTLAAGGDPVQAALASAGVGFGSQIPIAERLLKRQGILNKSLIGAEDVLSGTAKAVRAGGGKGALIKAGREASEDGAASALKSAGGLKASDVESATMGKLLVNPTSFIARRVINPSLRGAAVGAGMGALIEGTPQGAAEMAGQGLVIGPFGHAFDRAVGQLARPGVFKTPEGNAKVAILQNPETLARMKTENAAWLSTLPEASREAIEAHKPDEGVLFKIGDVHQISAGQSAAEGTAEQNQFNVYRSASDYDKIQTAIGGAGTAGSSQTVSDAMANAQNSLEAITIPKERTSLEGFIKELEGYGGATVKQPDGTFKGSGSDRTLNLINTSSPEFQSGSNVFHEVLGHGTFSLTGEDGTDYAQNLESAKKKVITSLIGIRDSEGKLVKDESGKALKTGVLGDNLEKSIIDYASLLPEQARQDFLANTQGKTPEQIAEEMFSETAGAFAREAPGSVSEYAQSIGRPNVMQRISKMLNLRQWLKQKGIAFIDSSDITGSFIFKDARGEPLQLTPELREGFAELVNLQNEATKRLSASRKAEDPGTTVTTDDIKINPSMANEFLASGYIKTRTKSSWELAAEAKAIFVENEKREPTPEELKKTLDDSIASGVIQSEAPQFTAKGEPIINKPGDIKKADKQRTEAIVLTMDSLGSDPDANALHKPEGKDFYVGSYLSENQLRAVEALSDKLVNRRMKSYLRAVSEHLRDPEKKGTPLQWLYYAATREGKYRSDITQSFRVASPTSMRISKANNFLVNMFDHSRFSAALNEAVQNKPNFFKLWGDVSTPEAKNQSVGLFLNNVEQYLSNHENGVNGYIGLHADPAQASKRASAINDFFNIKDADTKHLKAGEFPKNQFYRNLRVDRIGDISEGNLNIQGRKRNLPIHLQRQKTAFMPAVSDIGFYSQVEANAEKLPEKFSAEQLKSALSPEKGVKPDELLWMDYEGKFGNRKPDEKLTRQEVQDWINENKVDVQEVVKGQENRTLTPDEEKRLADLEKRNEEKPLGAIDDDESGSWNELLTLENIRDKSTAVDLENKQKEFEKLARQAQKKGDKKLADKYWERSNHYIARNEELQLSHPGKGGLQDDTKFSQYQIPGGENYKELLLTLPRSTTSKGQIVEKDGKFYIDGREDLGAFTTKERAGHAINDNKIGSAFSSSHFDEPNILAHIRFNERKGAAGEKILFIEEAQSDWFQKGRKDGYAGEGNTKGWTAQELVNGIYRVFNEAGEQMGDARGASSNEAISNAANSIERIDTAAGRVPDAPFKKTWPELLMKRMLRYASDKGFQKIAWTTGQMQADRYDLSKHVDKILWQKNKDGTIHADVKKGRESIIAKSGTPEEMEGVIGKDIVQRIMNAEGSKGTLEGDGLKIGGEGMAGFYDRILPSSMNKIGKKFGMKMSETDINTGNGETIKAHSVDLTPLAAEKLPAEGQPLFMPQVDISTWFKPTDWKPTNSGVFVEVNGKIYVPKDDEIEIKHENGEFLFKFNGDVEAYTPKNR